MTSGLQCRSSLRYAAEEAWTQLCAATRQPDESGPGLPGQEPCNASKSYSGLAHGREDWYYMEKDRPNADGLEYHTHAWSKKLARKGPHLAKMRPHLVKKSQNWRNSEICWRKQIYMLQQVHKNMQQMIDCFLHMPDNLKQDNAPSCFVG